LLQGFDVVDVEHSKFRNKSGNSCCYISTKNLAGIKEKLRFMRHAENLARQYTKSEKAKVSVIIKLLLLKL